MRPLPQTLLLSLTALLFCAITLHAENAAPTGKILFEVWNDVVGPNIADLKTSSYPNNPNESTYLSAFEAPVDYADTFGARISGFVHAPKTGEYTFWISSDDQGELWLSTDESPKNKQMICTCAEWSNPDEWEKYPAQKSNPIKLIAGKKYYIEAVYKENYRGDHCSVGWQIPGGPLERPIPGTRLSPAAKAKTEVVKTVPTKCVISGELPTKPGFHKLKATITKGQLAVELPFVLFLPNNYTATGEKFPMMTYLHGNSESGADLEGVYVFGPLIAMKTDKALRDSMNAIIIAPQVPLWKNWDENLFHKSVNFLVQELTNKLNIDTDRLSITGIEMGGRGSWRAALEAPNMYAAIVPMACEAVKPNEAPDLLKRSEIAIYVFTEDGGYTDGCRQMAKAFELRKHPVKLQLSEDGHAVWLKPYADRNFYQWVFDQRLKPEPKVVAVAPVVAAAPEAKTETKTKANDAVVVPASAVVASDATPAEAAAKPKNNTMLFVLIGAVTLGCGVIVFGIMRGRSSASGEEMEEDEDAGGIPMPGRIASVRRAKIAKT